MGWPPLPVELGASVLVESWGIFNKDNSPLFHASRSVDGLIMCNLVFNAGTVILLSAICITLFHHPALVSPAFASFPSEVGSGSSAAVAAGGSLIRSELVSSAWTGSLASCLHTFSGPDHLAALAPLSIGRTRMESAAVGALWGCGHDAGQLIFGLLFLLLKDRLHIEVIRTWGTRSVGLTLPTHNWCNGNPGSFRSPCTMCCCG